jgi:glucokinase
LHTIRPDAGAKGLADAAATGDPVAMRAFRRGESALAAMIASVAAGVAKSGPLLFNPLREALTEYARLDFLAGLVGAARLAGLQAP